MFMNCQYTDTRYISANEPFLVDALTSEDVWLCHSVCVSECVVCGLCVCGVCVPVCAVCMCVRVCVYVVCV